MDSTTQPFPPDEYLTPEEVQILHGMLQDQLRDILNESRDAVQELTEVRDVDADQLDLAVTESDRDFTLRLADRERRLLRKIKTAIERMKAGEYGTCTNCGSAITFQRLRARPVATQCIDCKTEAEQLERPKSGSSIQF